MSDCYYDLEAAGETSLSGRRLVRFSNSDQPTVRLPLDECMGSDLLAKLADRGMPLFGTRAVTKVRSLLAGIRWYPPARVVNDVGWTRNVFALPDGHVILPRGERAIESVFAPMANKSASVGTAEGWMHEVALPLTGQHIPMFLVMSAMAAPLRRVVGFPRSIAFELVGRAGIGKTLAQMITASVYGGVDHDPIPCASVVNDMGRQVAMHADILMLIDDPRPVLAGQTPAKLATSVRDLVVALTTETATPSRSGSGQGNTVVIAGRESFIDLLGATSPVSNTIRDRLITIKIDDNRPYGIFDRLPEGYTSSSELAAALSAAAQANHGMAAREYLRRLVQAIADDEAALIAKIRRWMAMFRAHSGVDANDGYAVQIVDTFGLVYAAGRLAKSFGVLPGKWNCGNAVLDCYRHHHAGHIPQRPILKVLAEIADSRDVVALPVSDDVSEKALADASVFMTYRGGKRQLLIRPDAIETYLRGSTKLLRRADVRQHMQLDGSHLTVQRRLGTDERERVYCFNLPAEMAQALPQPGVSAAKPKKRNGKKSLASPRSPRAKASIDCRRQKSAPVRPKMAIDGSSRRKKDRR